MCKREVGETEGEAETETEIFTKWLYNYFICYCLIVGRVSDSLLLWSNTIYFCFRKDEDAIAVFRLHLIFNHLFVDAKRISQDQFEILITVMMYLSFIGLSESSDVAT